MDKNTKPVIGKLYAKWCGYCTSLEPIWDKMRDSIEQQFPNKYTFSEIEQATEKIELPKLNKRHKTNVKVQGGYPTLFKINGGKLEYYNGKREFNDMMSWFISQKTKGGKSKSNNKNKRKHMKSFKRNSTHGGEPVILPPPPSENTEDKSIFIFDSDKISTQPNTDPKYKACGIIHVTDSAGINIARAFGTGLFNLVGKKGFDNTIFDTCRNSALQKLSDLITDNQKACNIRMDIDPPTEASSMVIVHIYGTLFKKV